MAEGLRFRVLAFGWTFQGLVLRLEDPSALILDPTGLWVED